MSIDFVELNDTITYRQTSGMPKEAVVTGIVLLDHRDGDTDGQYLNRINKTLINWIVFELDVEGSDSAKGWCYGEQVIFGGLE